MLTHFLGQYLIGEHVSPLVWIASTPSEDKSGGPLHKTRCAERLLKAVRHMFVLQCSHDDRSICSHRTMFRRIAIRQKWIFAAFRGVQNKADARAAPAVEWCDGHGIHALDRRASGQEAAQWCAKCPALSSEPPSNGCPT